MLNNTDNGLCEKLTRKKTVVLLTSIKNTFTYLFNLHRLIFTKPLIHVHVLMSCLVVMITDNIVYIIVIFDNFILI